MPIPGWWYWYKGCVVLPPIIPNMVGSFVPLHRPYLYAITILVSSIYNFLASYMHSVLSGRLDLCFFTTPCGWCALLISLLKIAWSKV